ncbi:3-carboxy-cis,cis-muconate cycloisomerase [Defluviimonas sp. 20V17]|uniref:3-carboxy-cis,cis-muconate cycloisomerase n=2 Tax=Allgaiera indica TaxID=765699 RepID=A0AAN4US94_9RHOB|nr:lyase family protein [Allgaiera indica]KDB02051.1 3-carboxy-cis,cis-muconate cycloisomerase [Defluviimonas sp. 20V17]GHE03102.1 3-carboxy-cis,cis-muconate cycloisomerase [Allgaiera indica]SDX11382.1 3-carboxy-cis,cis-muconate cycloisomerase [Allgaiera indica]
MPASPLDSALYRGLLGDDDTARLFTDSAEIRAMLLVEGALARVQGALGLIPEPSAAFLHRACHEVQIDPAALTERIAQDAVPVPALVDATRKALEAPAHAQYLHWGATSQDIAETGLVLRLRQTLAIQQARLVALIKALGVLAKTHAETPMAARTYGQAATPTSFGALVASWGAPLLRHLQRLEELRPRLLVVSLSGAAGTLGAMGPEGPMVRAELARALGLSDPGASWHSQRDRIAELAGWMTGLTTSLGKMGEDLMLLAQSGIEEVALGQGGGSSTMPQKQNPVAPSVLVALARQAAALNAALQGASVHALQRDAAAWITEWMALPQLAIGTGAALARAASLAGTLGPDAAKMRAALDGGLGLIHAEALSFALARRMPRPEAQAAVKARAKEARETHTPLPVIAARDWPDTDWAALLSAESQMGTAPAEARAFAAEAEALRTGAPQG